MNWWQRLLRRRQLEEHLAKELRFHLEQHTADLIARGHNPGRARRLAQQALGGEEQVKERCRDARGTRWAEDLLLDVRYAVRTLRRNPGFAWVAVLTLALGIGATTVMFTVVHSVLLKPLPYRDPEGLANLHEQTTWSTVLGNLWSFTYPNYLDCKRSVGSLDLAAWRYGGGTVSEPGEPAYVSGLEISSELFTLLGVTPVEGRGFRPDDDRPGAAPVAIIGHSLWQRRFGGDGSAIGRRIVFVGRPYTIVGIAPADFRLVEGGTDMFTPLGQDTAPAMQNREVHGVQVWARLRPGATLASAQSELSAAGGRLAELYPKSNQGRTFIAEPLRPDVADVRSTLWLLLGAVSAVLLVACANIASLLLARAVARERELAMRVALGASRGRLTRQCLTESALLGVCGGALGTLLAAFGLRPFLALWPGSLPRAAEVQIDWIVLLFALAVTLASSALFGLAPVLRAPVREIEKTLRAGARAVTAGSRRLHSSFVIAEIALAAVLLIAAGMLGTTLIRLSLLNPGVDARNVLTARLALPPAVLTNPDRIRAAWDDILNRARDVPGVQAVSMVDTVPMREGNNQIAYRTTQAAPPAGEQPIALATSVTPEYLKVMRIPLLHGRFFGDQDRTDRPGVVVIDEVMAEHAFGGGDPIGKQLWIELGSDPVTVVGVVGHVRYWGLASDDQARVRAQLYYPFAQVPDRFLRRWSELMSVAARTTGAPLRVIEPLRHALRGRTGDQVLYEVRTLEQLERDTLARQRFLLLLFAIFAGMALLLASIGTYGVLAYLTSRRVPEIGLRMALGANAAQVIWLIVRQSLVLDVAGIAAGGAVSLPAIQMLRRSVEGMRPAEPAMCAAIIGVVVAAALVASYLPARRASRVDPVQALRQE